MKNFIPVILLLLLASCSKETLTAPKSANQNIAVNAAVTFKDNSISIVNFKAQHGNKAIDITFTTLYEKDIVKLEILRGLTVNNLCSIYKQVIGADSYSSIKYSMSDQETYNVNTIYYIVKYTLADGDWGYTPIFQLSL